MISKRIIYLVLIVPNFSYKVHIVHPGHPVVQPTDKVKYTKVDINNDDQNDKNNVMFIYINKL